MTGSVFVVGTGHSDGFALSEGSREGKKEAQDVDRGAVVDRRLAGQPETLLNPPLLFDMRCLLHWTPFLFRTSCTTYSCVQKKNLLAKLKIGYLRQSQTDWRE